jgi:AraC-like DNA-binding protein
MEIDLISQLHRQDFDEFKYSAWESKWNTFVMVESGEYQLKLDGWQKPVILKENDIALVPPGIRYERKALTTISFYHFSFRTQEDHPFYRSVSAGKLPLPTERTQPILQSLARAMIIPDNRELITHIIEHIFAENYLFGRSKKTKLVPFSEEITSTVNYINRNLDKPLDVDELAARVYLSHSGLIWKFKKELGTTPSHYISLQRLRHAKQLLLNYPNYTVTQVAELCGYSNPFYFTNQFREYSGKSPTEFRRFHLKKDT